MNSSSSLHVVRGDSELVLKLLSTENKPNLLNIDALFFLKSLLHLQDGVVGVKVKALLATGESFDH